jgi:hypothetical protein
MKVFFGTKYILASIIVIAALHVVLRRLTPQSKSKGFFEPALCNITKAEFSVTRFAFLH